MLLEYFYHPKVMLQCKMLLIWWKYSSPAIHILRTRNEGLRPRAYRARILT
ncbi:MAG: hypothetical protein RIS94_250 [Pseudomonadota bacterium]